MLLSRTILPALAAAAVLAPGAAEAKTFCVNYQPAQCPLGAVDVDEHLQAGLDAAAASPGADAVVIVPGTYYPGVGKTFTVAPDVMKLPLL